MESVALLTWSEKDGALSAFKDGFEYEIRKSEGSDYQFELWVKWGDDADMLEDKCDGIPSLRAMAESHARAVQEAIVAENKKIEDKLERIGVSLFDEKNALADLLKKERELSEKLYAALSKMPTITGSHLEIKDKALSLYEQLRKGLT